MGGKCSVAHYLEQKNASFAPWPRCKSARYLRVSLWFAPCHDPKSIVFICPIKGVTTLVYSVSVPLWGRYFALSAVCARLTSASIIRPGLYGCSTVRAISVSSLDQAASAYRPLVPACEMSVGLAGAGSGRSLEPKNRGAAPTRVAHTSWQIFCKASTACAGAQSASALALPRACLLYTSPSPR